MPTLSGICHQVNADGFEARRRDEPTFFAQLSPGGSDGAFSDLDRSFDKLLSCLRMNKPQNFHTLVSYPNDNRADFFNCGHPGRLSPVICRAIDRSGSA